MSNSAWSLPTDVAGMVALNIKDKQFELLIGGNTDSSISAEVPDETALEMLALMDKSKVMTIVVGKAKPMNISLSGSSRALNAFRTCAHIRGNNEEAGSNPFK